MTSFFEEMKKQVAEDKIFLLAYYGASTVSAEFIFPNWGEIVRYVLKIELEDSLGAENSSSYIKAFWNLQTINMALNGASSRDLLSRLDVLILNKIPNLVILKDVVANDDGYRMPKNVTKENIERMIRVMLAENIKVVFASSIPSLRRDLNKKIGEYVKIDYEISDVFVSNGNFIFVDLFKFFPKEAIQESYTLIGEENEHYNIKEGEIDPIHYNRYGNALVAKILLREVFGIDFDHKKFLKDIADNTVKYPNY